MTKPVSEAAFPSFVVWGIEGILGMTELKGAICTREADGLLSASVVSSIKVIYFLLMVLMLVLHSIIDDCSDY